MKDPIHRKLRLLALALLYLGLSNVANADSLEIQRHMARGGAAMQMAKQPSDYLDAINEFSAATKLAPNMADAWFNLGVAQESAQQYRAAIDSFNTYLKLKPDAPDRTAVQSRTFALEYKADKADREMYEQQRRNEQVQAKANLFSGTWRSFMHEMTLVSGPTSCDVLSSGIGEKANIGTQPGEIRKVDECSIENDHIQLRMRGSGGGAYPFSYTATCEYALSGDGNRLTDGRYIRGEGLKHKENFCHGYEFKRVK